MTRLLVAVGVCGLAAALNAADLPAPAVDRLVARLGSDRFADREAAVAALEAAGPGAIPALEAATRSPNPEVSRRAAGVLVKLQRTADSARLTPKTVRLAYRNTPLGTAVNDLKARTGVPLTLDPLQVADPLRPVTCATADLPPWEAVEALCRAAGLREVFVAEIAIPKTGQKPRRGYYAAPPPTPGADGVAVVLADGTSQPLPGSRSTAVRVLALPPSFPGHKVILGTGDVALSFDVTPLPGLNWQEVAAVRVTKVIDDAGRVGSGGTVPDPGPQQPNDLDGVVFIGGLGGPGRMVALRWDNDGNPIPPTAHPNLRVVPVPIKVATPTARSLKVLEGAVVCEVLQPDQPLATLALPAQTGGSVDGVNGTRVAVVDVREAARGATVRVQVTGPSPWLTQRRRNPWGPLWPEPARPSTGTQVKAFDAAGRPVAAGTTAVNLINDDGVNVTTEVSATYPGGLPAKLVVVGPKPVLVEVPFKMENVPLP
jgi:hypothetical protein